MTVGNSEWRFWSMVEVGHPEKCWPWRGKVNNSGYGSFSFLGKVRGAHIWAWRFAKKKMPGSKCILHTCDNRRCCNPQHLFLGTKAENSQDSWKKGRNIFQINPAIRPRGENHRNAKITFVQANEIRILWQNSRLTQSEIGAKFGISQAAVSLIIRGINWKGGA